MAYPEKAGYKHQPKFLDRAIAEEKRADGGDVGNGDPYAALKPMQQTSRGDLVSVDNGPLLQHSNYLDYHRSVDDIVNEGSNPSSNARFHSSSGRNPDKGD